MSSAPQNVNISYRRSGRARYLRISVKPDGAVVVTVPKRAAIAEAEAFVRSKGAWIQKHLAKLQTRQAVVNEQPELSDAELNTAQEDLFARLAVFSERYELPYNRAAFRCQKTKWGSCSSRDNISLNINMVYLPRHLQDYLLLHELCHIRHKNHSKDFWALLDCYCGGKAKQYAKELRNQGMKIRR